MATSNPFAKLKIKHEEDDGEKEGFKEVKDKKQNIPFGIDEKKKKKARPPEQKPEVDDNDGDFEEVRKKKGKFYNKSNEAEEHTEETQKDKKPQRGGYYKHYPNKYQEQGKRQFDRRSGTGRGKEISKGGAGGKGTWGNNPNNMAREEGFDDYEIDKAINEDNANLERLERGGRRGNRGGPRGGPRGRGGRRGNRGGPRRDEAEEKEKEEKEEGQEDEKKEEEEPKEEKKVKPEFPKRELDEKDKLVRPEGAVTLEEYLKNQTNVPEEEEKKVVKKPKETQELQELPKEVEKEFGVGEEKKKKEKKTKKVEEEENEEINKAFENIKFGEERRPYRPERDNRKHGRGGKPRRGGRGHGDFVYKPNDDDFPELN